MAEVKHTYYDSGALMTECFVIDGKINGTYIENKKVEN